MTDETAIDLAQKIMKQTIRDLGDKAVDPRQMALINTLVDLAYLVVDPRIRYR